MLDRDSVTSTISEYWVLKLGELAYAPRVPAAARASFQQRDMRRVIEWMKSPDSAYGPNPAAARDQILLTALEQAVADLQKRLGTDMSRWVWGDIHTADFAHALLSDATKPAFFVEPVRRGGDAYTVQASSSATQTGSKQTSGASFKFVFDVKDWDNSTGLSTPRN